jgi:hypothetical protein
LFPILLLLNSQLELSSNASFSCAPKFEERGIDLVSVIRIVSNTQYDKEPSGGCSAKTDQREEELV